MARRGTYLGGSTIIRLKRPCSVENDNILIGVKPSKPKRKKSARLNHATVAQMTALSQINQELKPLWEKLLSDRRYNLDLLKIEFIYSLSQFAHKNNVPMSSLLQRSGCFSIEHGSLCHENSWHYNREWAVVAFRDIYDRFLPGVDVGKRKGHKGFYYTKKVRFSGETIRYDEAVSWAEAFVGDAKLRLLHGKI